ncbi:methyltransferase [Actinomadura sp. CNU-125]|uniref:class I SAM-dependent methyltransferase n=1 Tax=Actinomadura sp. CNU-125 TaxID=1904961 RepID=UPI0009675E61|nr:class I SAM-dependent methyltransferase [Actinomadura sp. CNU-125]OLT19122.1 methyltransferase [Actinomadura sp. CNU-125]
MRLQVILNDTLQDYISAVSLRESELLQELREKTADTPFGLMQVPPEEGQFLSVLAMASGARRTLEIGVFTGYSLLSTALAIPEDGLVVGLEQNEEWADMAFDFCERAGVAHKVDLRIGDARRSLASLLAERGAAESFDLVFIDANKEDYQTYFEGALVLLRRGGLIVVDNVLWHGAVANATARDSETRALREFNARLHRDERVAISMIPFADGMTLAVKR